MSEVQVPLISIITATYNRSNVLKFAIMSVLRQTYANWELLIVMMLQQMKQGKW